MATDWRDQRRTDVLRAFEVQPSNLQQGREITGVLWGKSSLTAGYYTDTRCGGKLVVLGGSMPARDRWVRITHEVPEWGYRRTLGTFLVKDESWARSGGAWERTMELSSPLYGLSTDLAHTPWTVGAGARYLRAIDQLLVSKRHALVGAADRAAAQPVVMPSGKSVLSRLFDLCAGAGDRLDVEPDGTVVVRKYVNPAARTPSMTIDLADPRGLAEGGLSMTDTSYTRPTEAVVRYKWTTSEKGADGKSHSVEHEAIGTAYATGSQSAATRGFVVTDWADTSDEHHADLNQMARANLSRRSADRVAWQLSTLYAPLWEGDVVSLVLHGGPPGYSGTRKCLVKSVDVSFAPMSCKLSLKETGSPDEDGE